jgi:hypothetical protein
MKIPASFRIDVKPKVLCNEGGTAHKFISLRNKADQVMAWHCELCGHLVGNPKKPKNKKVTKTITL